MFIFIWKRFAGIIKLNRYITILRFLLSINVVGCKVVSMPLIINACVYLIESKNNIADMRFIQTAWFNSRTLMWPPIICLFYIYTVKPQKLISSIRKIPGNVITPM